MSAFQASEYNKWAYEVNGGPQRKLIANDPWSNKGEFKIADVFLELPIAWRHWRMENVQQHVTWMLI